MCLASAPPEVISQILRFLEKKDLKAVRQGSRLLEALATPLLFVEIVAAPYAASIEGLTTNLARNPSIRHAVKHLHYDTRCFLDSKTISGDSTSSDLESDNGNRTGDYEPNTCFGAMQRKRPGFRRQYETIQQTAFYPYTTAFVRRLVNQVSSEDVRTNLEHEVDTLANLLQHFTSIKRVSLSGRKVSRIFDEKDHEPRPIPHFYVKIRCRARQNDSADAWLHDLADVIGKCDTEVVPYRARSLLNAVCSLDHRAIEVQITRLDFGVFHRRLFSNQNWSLNDLRPIKNLRLHFYREVIEHGKQADTDLKEHSSYLAYALAQTKDLEELAIDFQYSKPSPYYLLQHIIDQDSIPPLKRMTLDCTLVSGDLLVDVLRRLSSSLTSLELSDIYLKRNPWNSREAPSEFDDWVRLIKFMAEELALEQVELSGRLTGSRQTFYAPSARQIRSLKSTKLADKLAVSRLHNAQMDWPLEPKTYTDALSSHYELYAKDKFLDERECLRSRIFRYILKGGIYPQELDEFEAEVTKRVKGLKGMGQTFGDYSWIMENEGKFEVYSFFHRYNSTVPEWDR